MRWRSSSGELLLVGMDLTQRTDQQREVDAEPQEVTGVDPIAVERREQEVVEPRKGGQHATHGDPAHQLVGGSSGPGGKPDGRPSEQQHAEHLNGEQRGVADDARSLRAFRRDVGVDAHR
jgi:hypothetical protein